MHHAHDERPTSELSRREFLQLAGAGVALAGLDGCARMPAEHILPYVDNRPEITPGVASYYATAMMLDGFATGLLVKCHEGRPTKIEGNPAHPASLGAAGPIEQASVLQLYDPDRAKHGRIAAARASWREISARLAPTALRSEVGATGDGLRILIEPTSSLLDEELLEGVLRTHPGAHIHMYAPLLGDRATEAFVTQYDIASADVILAVDSDFLATGPFHLRYARQFADRRRLANPTDAMNRLYVAESAFTSTGAAADHRFAIRPRDIVPVLRRLRAELTGTSSAPESQWPWLPALARDLRAHTQRALVIVGDAQPAEARQLAASINESIGATGNLTWTTSSPLIGRRVSVQSFSALTDAMQSRAVSTLIIVGGNPSYASPARVGFSKMARTIPDVGYVGLYENETARDARWFVPMSHYLESWGDARAYDGTVSIVQPTVKPLYESITPAMLYAALAGDTRGATDAYGLLRASWDRRVAGDSEAAWVDALQRGITSEPALPRSSASPALAPVPLTASTPEVARDTLDVLYLGDPRVYDGSFANNGWLQELPSPITQLTWGNAALMSPRTAHRLGARDGQMVRVSRSGRQLEIPALAVPGHADDTVSLHLGYGRTGGESLARDVGVNVYTLWPNTDVRAESGVSVVALPDMAALSRAQTTLTQGPGHAAREATLDVYRQSPSRVGQSPGRVLSLYPTPPRPPHASDLPQWAMTIDLTTCIGCGACVVGCQAENNIPVVGASEVSNGRAMQWIHVERYFVGPEHQPRALLQPMLCQHCEQAPCEYVCPVGATVHSDEGLNEMVYNRCVGTRFCSNNCPYKVRHFNWFDYNAHLAETELMVKNPNVTVRERGVMEKCTFCVQRIREAEIAAGREERPLRSGEVVTACQQACPTNAIVFGSLTDASAKVVAQREQPRAYAALADLGTEPRVRYLAHIRNANPDIDAQ